MPWQGKRKNSTSRLNHRHVQNTAHCCVCHPNQTFNPGDLVGAGAERARGAEWECQLCLIFGIAHWSCLACQKGLFVFPWVSFSKIPCFACLPAQQVLDEIFYLVYFLHSTGCQQSLILGPWQPSNLTCMHKTDQRWLSLRADKITCLSVAQPNFGSNCKAKLKQYTMHFTL